MSWLRGRYYVRSVKQSGRVVNQYVGGGELGEAAAALDASLRARRRLQADAWRAEKAQLEELEADLIQLCEATERMARSALAAAGYHQHDRGEWRRRRETQTEKQ